MPGKTLPARGMLHLQQSIGSLAKNQNNRPGLQSQRNGDAIGQEIPAKATRCNAGELSNLPGNAILMELERTATSWF
ncbi:hypothetical protein MY1884_006139 [Beauveria asiatica]